MSGKENRHSKKFISWQVCKCKLFSSSVQILCLSCTHYMHLSLTARNCTNFISTKQWSSWSDGSHFLHSPRSYIDYLTNLATNTGKTKPPPLPQKHTKTLFFMYLGGTHRQIINFSEMAWSIQQTNQLTSIYPSIDQSACLSIRVTINPSIHLCICV